MAIPSISEFADDPEEAVGDELILTFAQRQIVRQRATLTSGKEVFLKMPRGTVLQGGDLLRMSTGNVVLVVAQPELVSIVESHDKQGLARAAYHLGNRHVPVEIGSSYIFYLNDHVLDDMIRNLGFDVNVESKPFHPERGAYHTHNPKSMMPHTHQ